MGLRRSRTSVQSEVRTPVHSVPLPIWQEILVGIEMVYLRLSPVYWGFGIPPGDGSAVVLIPALLLTDLYFDQVPSRNNPLPHKRHVSRTPLQTQVPHIPSPAQTTPTNTKAITKNP